MNKRPFYTYYVAHVIKQYFNNKAPENPTKAYKLNWDAADKVISHLSEHQQNILREVYKGYGKESIATRVYFVAEKYHEDKYAVWDIISYVERKVAQERELI